MSETLFPERSRCRTCRGALGKGSAPVLLGLYCSPKCAGMPEPVSDPADPACPRECRTKRDGEWVFKRRYRAKSEIPSRLRWDPSTGWYWCQHCGHLHVGRTLVELPRAETRGLRSRKDIADVLIKARGKATHKQVAQAIGVRPIRIKEWEDERCDAPSLQVLFALLKVYRLDMAVVFNGPTGR